MFDLRLFNPIDKNTYILDRKNAHGQTAFCMVVTGEISNTTLDTHAGKIDCLISMPGVPDPSAVDSSGTQQNTYVNAEKTTELQGVYEAKSILLKPGHFLVEFLPEENGDNYEYLYRVKELARQAGFEYYAKVPWKKGEFVANTGRKSKNTEDIVFFSKGKARDLRPDAKKNKAEPGVDHFMSGAAGMLPTVFDVSPVAKGEKVHQAEKPVELLEQILRFVTKEDELVLDQFAGSGALGEAALQSHRDSILIEKDLDTFNRMRERVSALGEVNVYTEDQRAFINVAIDAVEAHADGPEAFEAFAAHQNKSKLPLKEVSHQLWMLPEEQPENVAAAIDYAKMIVASDEYPKVLECSSRGDKRFSPLYAKVTIKGIEKSIEEWYQGAKRTEDGKRVGKGKPFAYIVDPFTGDQLPKKEAPDLYRGLWFTYFAKNPDLVKYAEQFDEFSNFYSGKSIENGYQNIIHAYVKGDRERYIAVVKCSSWYKNMARHKRSLSEKIAEAASVTSGGKSDSVCSSQVRDGLEPVR